MRDARLLKRAPGEDDADRVLAGMVEAFSGRQLENVPKPLELQGDIAAQMIEGADKFLLRELEASIGRRGQFWSRDSSSADAYTESVEPNRRRLAAIIGVRDERPEIDGLEFTARTVRSAAFGLVRDLPEPVPTPVPAWRR